MAAAPIVTANSQAGHVASSTNCPFLKTALGYLKKNWNMQSPQQRGVCRWLRLARSGLVRHSVQDVIQPHAKRHRRECLRIIRIVRPLLRIAEVHVVADRDNNSAMAIANGPPFGLVTVFLISAAGPHILFTRYLHLVVDVIQSVKDLVATF